MRNFFDYLLAEGLTLNQLRLLLMYNSTQPITQTELVEKYPAFRMNKVSDITGELYGVGLLDRIPVTSQQFKYQVAPGLFCDYGKYDGFLREIASTPYLHYGRDLEVILYIFIREIIEEKRTFAKDLQNASGYNPSWLTASLDRLFRMGIIEAKNYTQGGVAEIKLNLSWKNEDTTFVWF